jgi:hypothetical protein
MTRESNYRIGRATWKSFRSAAKYAIVLATSHRKPVLILTPVQIAAPPYTIRTSNAIRTYEVRADLDPAGRTVAHTYRACGVHFDNQCGHAAARAIHEALVTGKPCRIDFLDGAAVVGGITVNAREITHEPCPICSERNCDGSRHCRGAVDDEDNRGGAPRP